MNSTSEVQWQEWDESAADAIEAAPGGSRRRLLAGAGGLVLAASGRSLPEWREEAEARKGTLGGANGGRRGKDHRGRHRKRNHGDRKKHKVKDIPLPFRRSALTVGVSFYDQPIHCSFFAARNQAGDNYAPFQWVEDYTIYHSTSTDYPLDKYRFDSGEMRAGVLIREFFNGQDVFCDVRNMRTWFPRGRVTAGDNLDPAKGTFGAEFIAEQGYFEGEEQQSGVFRLQRQKDDSNGARRIEWFFTAR